MGGAGPAPCRARGGEDISSGPRRGQVHSDRGRKSLLRRQPPWAIGWEEIIQASVFLEPGVQRLGARSCVPFLHRTSKQRSAGARRPAGGQCVERKANDRPVLLYP